MIIHQYYRYGKLTSVEIIPQESRLNEETYAWLHAQLLMNPLSRWEEDGDFYWDTHEISLNKDCLIRYQAKWTSPERLLVDNQNLEVLIASGAFATQIKMVSEPPPNWRVTHHNNPLPYEGILGLLHEPKRLHFHVFANSPAQALEEVALRVVDSGISLDKLTLHAFGLGIMSSSTFRHRNDDEKTHFSISKHELWKHLLAHREQVQNVIRKVDLHYKDILEQNYRTGEAVAGELFKGIIKETQLTQLGAMAKEALNSSSASNLPRELFRKVLFINEDNEMVTLSSNTFSFNERERNAIAVQPTIRFFVLHNIPLNAELSVREQLAWCRHQSTEHLAAQCA